MVSEYRSKFFTERHKHTMAQDQFALLDLLGQLKLTVSDRIRTATETLYQQLIDAEGTVLIGAAPFERAETPTAQRNRSRPRTLTTIAGNVNLKIPKRAGSFFAALLERRSRVVLNVDRSRIHRCLRSARIGG